MRLNQNTKIVGQKVILVPYEAKHVKKYHQWMQNHELQELTASEPLTIEEEYAMQRSWRDDEDKCTFLVLCRQSYDTNGADEIAALVGDTNLFLRRDPDKEIQVAEAEIMIAEPKARGKGYGWESMLLLLKYAQTFLDVQMFEAKIGMDNVSSLQLFKKMQFVEVNRVEVFREVTLSRAVTAEWVQWLDTQVQLQCEEYKE